MARRACVIAPLIAALVAPATVALAHGGGGGHAGGGGHFGGGGGHFGGMSDGFGGMRGGDVGGFRGADGGGLRGGDLGGFRGDDLGGMRDAGIGRGFDGQRDFDGAGGGQRLDGTGRLDGAGRLDGRGADPAAWGLGGAGHRFAGEANLSRVAGLSNRGIRPYSVNALTGRGNIIRNNFYNHGWYGGRGWYDNHFGCWWGGGWWFGGGLLTGLAWADLASWGGYGGGGGGTSAAPVSYDYGTTVCYQDDGVYVQGERVGSAEAYARGAADLAAAGTSASPGDDDQWRSLGVFAMARAEESDPSNFLSLAVDRDGLMRGTYYNAATEESQHVTGKVDRKTQRAAWTIGDKKTPVYEAGISNLTKDQLTILAHKSDGSTEQLLLVRVKDQAPGSEKPPAR